MFGVFQTAKLYFMLLREVNGMESRSHTYVYKNCDLFMNYGIRIL